jgi:hypothetical protein
MWSSREKGRKEMKTSEIIFRQSQKELSDVLPAVALLIVFAN